MKSFVLLMLLLPVDWDKPLDSNFADVAVACRICKLFNSILAVFYSICSSAKAFSLYSLMNVVSEILCFAVVAVACRVGEAF